MKAPCTAASWPKVQKLQLLCIGHSLVLLLAAELQMVGPAPPTWANEYSWDVPNQPSSAYLHALWP